MTAKVERTGSRRYQAWCPTCTDGSNGSKAAADEWAAAHNHAKHPAQEETR